MEEKNIETEQEHTEEHTQEQAQESTHGHNYYVEIIEQQKKLIEQSNNRIDELTKQVTTLINNGGNYHEPISKNYSNPYKGLNDSEIAKPFEDMDFSL